MHAICIFKKLYVPFLFFVSSQYYSFANDGTWKKIDNFLNNDASAIRFLWAFLDNVSFQHGYSKIWEHGEVYCGLNNGIGLFPSIWNFGWLKIGLCDVHVNVINVIIHAARVFVRRKASKTKTTNNRRKQPVTSSFKYDILSRSTHLFSFKIFNSIKIKLISVYQIFYEKLSKCFENFEGKYWYFSVQGIMSDYYELLSPQIEINIAELISYFKKIISKPSISTQKIELFNQKKIIGFKEK